MADNHSREAKAHRLFDAAFNKPRDPRSPAYKEGVLATLRYYCNNIPVTCPYPEATAEADAFFAGRDEGNKIWAANLPGK